MSKQLKFIHITKTSGTYICNQAYKKKIRWGKFHGEYGSKHTFFTTRDKSLKNKYDWFLVCRNPYERCISELFWLIRNNEKHLRQHPFKMTWEELSHLNKYRNNTLVTAENISQDICYYIDLFTKKIEPNGGHFSPIYKYLDDSTTINIVHFENIQNEFADLMNKYNIDVSLPNWKTNKYLEKYNFDSTQLTEKCKDKVRDLYKQDFITFNYDM